MRLVLMCLLVLSSTALPAVAGQQGPPAAVAETCKREIEAYCRDVNPGEGRLAACLYANEYKLSSRCEQALFDAAAELEHAVANLNYLVNECRVDLATFCSRMQPGEGRLIDCLDKNRQKLSARCKLAFQGVAVKK